MSPKVHGQKDGFSKYSFAGDLSYLRGKSTQAFPSTNQKGGENGTLGWELGSLDFRVE